MVLLCSVVNPSARGFFFASGAAAGVSAGIPGVRAQPGVLSAEALFGQVWDEHVDPFTNTVHVTLSRLRRKLGDPPAIATLPGVGYRVTEAEPGSQ